MEDGLNGKHGVRVQKIVVKALDTECEVVVDQNQKDLDKNVVANLYKLLIAM